MNYKNIKKNLIIGVLGQIIILSLGIVLPRVVLTYFGSEINGLLATSLQVFAYVSLLQSGIGNAAIILLYKEIGVSDKNQINEIYNATVAYYRKVSKVYLIVLIIIVFTFPFFINTTIQPSILRIIILFQGIPGYMFFFHVLPFEVLLSSEGKSYIVQGIDFLVRTFIVLTKIILIIFGFNIVIVQFSFVIVSLAKVVIMKLYYKHNYSWIKIEKSNNTLSLLKQRRAFLIHEISSTIFNNTDILTISIFLGFASASVYSVYNLVFLSLHSFITTVNRSFTYVLGQTFHIDKKRYMQLHDTYDNFYITLVFSVFSIAFILIVPFVELYTRGIQDIIYVDYFLPILFVLLHLLSSTRAVSSVLINISGHAPKTQINTVIEALINIIVSVILVNFLGMYGVLIGSIVALLYRSNDIIIYANRKILNRSPLLTYKHFAVNILLFTIAAGINANLTIVMNSLLDFFKMGFVVSTLIFCFFFSVNLILNQNLYKDFLNFLKL